MFDNTLLQDRVAVITGGGTGIGLAIARRLGTLGAKIAIASRQSENLEHGWGALRESGIDALAVQLDVRKPEQVDEMVERTVKHFGALDILVNNAGVYEFSPLEAITPDHFHRQFNVNVLGLLLTTQEAVKVFPSTGGSVINIGSVVSSITPPSSAVYTATKGAVDAITGVLAKELGSRGIRVNALNPGIVETEGSHAAGFIGSDFEKHATSQTPLGRTGQPEDIAKVAVFLASDESGWLTGEEIRAGGGMH
jgi:3-oxoacyl-[acyl-carrier protein] reductase